MSLSPVVAQRYDLTGKLEKVGIRVIRAGWPVTNAFRIHIVRWEELPRRHTDQRLRLVVIADRAQESEQREAVRRGAAALIAAQQLRDALEPVLRSVNAGYHPMPHDTVSMLVSRLEVPPTSIGANELALLEQLLQGASTMDIAAALGCSERHARRRLRALWDQMGVSGRREGLATAVRWGLAVTNPH